MTDLASDLSIDDLVERDQRAIACPYPIFSQLRDDAPVYYSDRLGAWVCTRYDDILAVLHDTDRFSSNMPTGPSSLGELMGAAMQELAQDPAMAKYFEAVMARRGQAVVLLNADPPDHRRQRKLVNGAFRPSRMRGIEPMITEVAERLADGLCDRTEAEFVADFAVGLPMTIIAYALGVGDDDLATFKRWSDDLVMPVGNPAPTVEEVRSYLISSTEFSDFFADMLAERREHPARTRVGRRQRRARRRDAQPERAARDAPAVPRRRQRDHHEAVDEHLSPSRHRSRLQERVRSDRSLVEGLVEEALRYEAPVGGLFRQAKVDAEVGGVAISAGDHVWCLYAAANRDGERFPDPDAFDVCRANARDHIAFGHGEHYCIGAALARAEARIGTNALLDRLADIRLADDNDFSYENTFVLRGLRSLHITYTPITG